MIIRPGIHTWVGSIVSGEQGSFLSFLLGIAPVLLSVDVEPVILWYKDILCCSLSFLLPVQE